MPELTWIGKDKVINHHLDVPFRTLERQYSFDEKGEHKEDNSSENMIIHGDNLEALKSLLPKYERMVDCIVIDPPYNTGSEHWVYNDNVNDPTIKKWIGSVVGSEAEDLSRHDKWLCMMYPRIQLLKKLLKEDGVLFIFIGEDELSNLRHICDEILGSRNFIGYFTRQMKSGGAKGHFYTPSTDFILTYAKNIEEAPYFRAVMTNEQIDNFYKFTEKDGPRKGEKYGEERLFKASLDARANQRYYIQCPDGSFCIPPGSTFPNELSEGLTVKPESSDKVWKWIYPRYKRELEQGNIVFKKTKTSGLVDENGNKSNWNIYNKLWLSEQQEKGVVPSNLITGFENRQSAAETKALNINFDYAKPCKLIEYLLTIANRGKNAIFLDSFAGSGTTANAVLNMNKSDDGNRQFILCELGDYADSITAERIKKTISGYGKENSQAEGTGGHFSFYELGPAVFLEDGSLNPEVDDTAVMEYVWYSETGCELQSANGSYLGKHNDVGYYFFRNKTFNYKLLATIKEKAEGYVVYADKCSFSEEELLKYSITFKKIARDIRRV